MITSSILKMNKSVFKTDTFGNKYWYLNGKLHREDGPACEYTDGNKSWWKNGQRHREDGPAIEYYDGTKYWYLNGNEIDDPNKCHNDCCKLI